MISLAPTDKTSALLRFLASSAKSATLLLAYASTSSVSLTIFCSFSFSGRNYPVFRQQISFRQHQVPQPKQTEQLCRVFLQAPIAHLAMPKYVLDDMKRMLNFGANRCLSIGSTKPVFAAIAGYTRGKLHCSYRTEAGGNARCLPGQMVRDGFACGVGRRSGGFRTKWQ